MHVAVPVGLPARRGQVGRPRIGRVREVRGDLLIGGGWVVGVVRVAGQQVPQPRLVGDDPDRLGPADRNRILITILGQTLRDPVHQRQERGRITGVDPGDQGAQSVAGLGGPHIPLRRRPGRALLVGLLINLQQGGIEELLEPAPGQQLDLPGHDPVHDPRRHHRQLRGAVGDLAGLPRPHLTGLDPFPQLRQPMPDRQRVADQQPGRDHTRLLRQRQRRRTGLRHQRGAERTHPDEPLHQHRVELLRDRDRRSRRGSRPTPPPAQLTTPRPPLDRMVVRSQAEQLTRISERLLQPLVEHTDDYSRSRPSTPGSQLKISLV